MIISTKYNVLIIQTKYAAQIKAMMPEAILSKQFPDTIYVPWTLARAQQLATLGFYDTVSPIERDYTWPTGQPPKIPYKHQHVTASFCTLFKRGFIINGIGSGKTNSVLWALDYLMSRGEVRKALIMCTLSTIDCVWGDTLFYEFHHRKFAILSGPAERRNKLFADPKYDFYVINHDGFGAIKKQYLTRTDIDAVVIDESTAYKDQGIRRFKRVRNAFDDNPPKYMWAMSAEPTPNEPTDAWGQARLLHTHQNIGFTAFKEMTMQKVSNFKWIPRENSHLMVASILSPAVRFATRDCIDLPDTIYSTRKAQLTQQQHSLYTQMLNQYAIDFSNGTVNAVNEADKQNKLLQIICGFVYSRDPAGQVITQVVDAQTRLTILDEILASIKGKAIIFVPYTELLFILEKHLSKYRTCRLVYGQTKKAERYEIFTEFQKSPDPTTIIAHPKTMAHGITLTAAATIIWYAPYASAGYYSQANGRIVRPSQTKITNIFHIIATELEKRIYNRLLKRQEVQGTLLDFIKERQDGRISE